MSRCVFLAVALSMLVPLSGCRLVQPGPQVGDMTSSKLLGQRYARVSLSRLETGDVVLDELDNFISALHVDVNLPATEHIDIQGYLGRREASGESFDPFFGPYQMSVTGWHLGAGLVGHARPDDMLDPYVFVSGQFLSADVSYQDLVGVAMAEEDDFGWVAGGGIEWRPNHRVAIAPYIKYFDNGTFGEGTRVGGRLNTWLDETWFLEVSGEAPISESGHSVGVGLGFRF